MSSALWNKQDSARTACEEEHSRHREWQDQGQGGSTAHKVTRGEAAVGSPAWVMEGLCLELCLKQKEELGDERLALAVV